MAIICVIVQCKPEPGGGGIRQSFLNALSQSQFPIAERARALKTPMGMHYNFNLSIVSG